jgi:hypothetical protein
MTSQPQLKLILKTDLIDPISVNPEHLPKKLFHAMQSPINRPYDVGITRAAEERLFQGSACSQAWLLPRLRGFTPGRMGSYCLS